MSRPCHVFSGFALGSILLLSACPDKPIQKARSLEKKAQPEAAAEAYLAAAKADRANLAAWDGALRIWCKELARVDRCLEVLDLEINTLGNITRHHDLLSEALEKRGRMRLSKGLTKSALMDFERALKAGPNRASVLVAKAKAYNTLGIRHLAVRALQRARELDPHSAEADEVAKTIPEEEGFGGQNNTQASPTSPSR